MTPINKQKHLRFKDKEGKDFPNWKNKKLGEVALFSKGKGISKADINKNGSVDCIRYGELYTTYNEVITDVVSKTDLSPNELIFSEYNDVIIPASGETQLDIATAACVLKDGVALSGDINIIKSSMNGVFLAYYLKNAKKTEIASLSQGSSVIHLYSTQLKALNIAIPIKEEQNKISEFLYAIDNKIEKMQEQLEELKTYKKGLMQTLFAE